MTAGDDLVADVRAALAEAGTLREVRMFGGIGFMLNGNMVAAVSRRGLLLRVGKERYAEALAQPDARAVEMRGRRMEGYVRVDPEALTRDAVRSWLARASAFVRSLPPKAADSRPKRKGQRE
jgi:TfoX/Sxy family transcriptional regulator of competence genes